MWSTLWGCSFVGKRTRFRIFRTILLRIGLAVLVSKSHSVAVVQSVQKMSIQSFQSQILPSPHKPPTNNVHDMSAQHLVLQAP